MRTIEITGLTKYYGKERGIIDLNLSVDEGDIFGFVGPNGAGKSTTIRLLLGLITATKGRAKIFDMDCRTQTTQILKRIGYMPSETRFYDNLKVEEMIEFSARLHKKDCRKEAKKLCERFEIDTKKKIEDLSLGNRKKVSIVCAMQHEPDLYILDEATSGLDPLMQKEFFEVLKEKNKKGTTIFLSSHVLSEVQNNCNKVGIVREGKLITVNTVEEFSKNAAKKIWIKGIDTIPNLPGVINSSLEDNTLSFMYKGEIPTLIKALNDLPIIDMSISEPSLEEIFMHFYEKGNGEDDGEVKP